MRMTRRLGPWPDGSYARWQNVFSCPAQNNCHPPGFMEERKGSPSQKGLTVIRFTIRELLWLTLIVAVVTGWQLESARARTWRQRAEIAAGQLEAENLGHMVFHDGSVIFESSYYDEPLRKTVIPTNAR
jgi:hypothetical protein